ncbi:Clp protease N-terminal domain-containing protein, partial [Thermoleptolyngbya sp. M55_K2018_002]
MQPTSPDKFTEKAWEAIVNTQEIARQSKQQQIETEHLMKALLEQDGLAVSIFNRAGVNVQRVREFTDSYIARQPKVSG